MTTYPWRRRLVIALLDLATAALLVLWWANTSKQNQLIVSTPSPVLQDLGRWFHQSFLIHSITATLSEAAAGLLLGLAGAIVFASLMASAPIIAEFFSPFIQVLNTVPKIALAPVFLLVFGIGYQAKVYFVAAVVFFIPFYALLRALTTIEPVYLDNVTALGGRRVWRLFDVYVPSAIGSTVTSLRVSLAHALSAAVVSELIVSNRGIGFEIQQAQSSAEAPRMISAILVITAIAFVADRLLKRFAAHFAQWRVTA